MAVVTLIRTVTQDPPVVCSLFQNKSHARNELSRGWLRISLESRKYKRYTIGPTYPRMDHCLKDEVVSAMFAGKSKKELESTFVVKYCCKLRAVPPQGGPDMRVPMYIGACTRAWPVCV